MSKSKRAQDKLIQLEKASATYGEHLEQACKFIGIRSKELRKPHIEQTKSSYFGREEWLLRWLLKKLQAQDGDSARKHLLSWRLLARLFRSIPVTNLARILSEKKFLSILKQSLESVKETDQEEVLSPTRDHENNDGPHVGIVSKKRRRNGEIVSIEARFDLQDWMDSVYAAVSFLVGLGKATATYGSSHAGSALSAAYVKTVLHTSAEESASILGAWLDFCSRGRQELHGTRFTFEVSAITDLWQHISPSNENLLLFSLHCSSSLLSLLQNVGESEISNKDAMIQLEQLVARNLIVPARNDFLNDSQSELLGTLTRVSIIQSPISASILFDVAIRSMQSPGAKPRSPQDAEWLQKTFVTFKEAMSPRKSKEQHQAMRLMVQSAIRLKVDIEAATLRDLLYSYALQGEPTDWELISVVMELDATIFVISKEANEIRNVLLSKTTEMSTMDSAWPEVGDTVAAKILVPLMRTYAKSRDLSGFIRIWYYQLVEVAKLRQDHPDACLDADSAWERRQLSKRLRDVFEVSLTPTQIQDMLDWLSARVDKDPGPVCTLLEAIAGSLTRENLIDAVGLQLYHIMFDGKGFDELADRYKAKAWRLLTQLMPQLSVSQLHELALLWEQGVRPYDRLMSRAYESIQDDGVAAADIEALRSACTAWLAVPEGSALQAWSKPIVLGFLDYLASGQCGVKISVESSMAMAKDSPAARFKTVNVTINQHQWPQLRSILAEYPRIFLLASELPLAKFKELWQHLMWGASIAQSVKRPEPLSKLLENDDQSLMKIWVSICSTEGIFNDSKVIDYIIDALFLPQLSDQRYTLPHPGSAKCDMLAVQTFLGLPLELLIRKHRERIMQRWSLQPNTPLSIVHPAVLSLRVKLLQRFTFYEGMSFEDLLALVSLIESDESPDLPVVLGILKRVVELTLMQISTNLNQPRSHNYLAKGFKMMEQKVDGSYNMRCSPALFTVLQPLLALLIEKGSTLEDFSIITQAEARALQTSSSKAVSKHLGGWTRRLNDKERLRGATYDAVGVISLIDMLVDPSEKASNQQVYDIAKSYLARRTQQACDMVTSELAPDDDVLDLDSQPQADATSVYGRQMLANVANTWIAGSRQDLSEMLLTTLGPRPTRELTLEALVTIRQVIQSCEDTKSLRAGEDDTDESVLPVAYFGLCRALQKSTSIRQFSIICSILDIMLKSKPHAATQWNIDTTLASITLICSRQGPRLRPAHAGIIYLHLCTLLRTILVSYTHRLKLQGHFHHLLQTMQSLLRCLFLPQTHSPSPHHHHHQQHPTFPPPPPWLLPTQPLQANHALALSRLISSICDPTPSSVSRPQHSSHPHAKALTKANSSSTTLTSATDKAKKLAAQHMRFLLSLYIKGQLEMRMVSGVRAALVSGIHAIFDTTSREGRKALGEALDGNGRAVLQDLIKDWLKFGKWGGG